MQYATNNDAARAADNTSPRISEAGFYMGEIVSAEETVAGTGTKGVALAFRADTGASVVIYLNTVNGAGEKLPGYNVLNAILVCLRLPGIRTQAVEIEKWNSERKQRERVTVQGFPTLHGRRLGLMLRKEIRDGDKGDLESLQPIAVTDEKLFTAAEILDGAPVAERYKQHQTWLEANPVRDSRKKKGTAQGAPAATTASAGGSGFGDFADDVPY